MMNFQQSQGDFSPNILGDNNQTNPNSKNIKVSFGCKARYTFLGFLIGIATSYAGSYLYDNYKIDKVSDKTETEIPVTNQLAPSDSIK